MPEFLSKTDFRKLVGCLLYGFSLQFGALVASGATTKTILYVFGAESLGIVGTFLVDPKKATARVVGLNSDPSPVERGKGVL